MISIIAAITANSAIEIANQFSWHFPNDLKRFRRLTIGHTVIMGRKTFESLPNGPLPKRRNIVVSRNTQLTIEGAEVYSSLDYALLRVISEPEVFIIGGAQIYAQALPIANKLYLTRIHAAFPGADAFFPSIDWNIWVETLHATSLPADEKNPYPFTFLEYERL